MTTKTHDCHLIGIRTLNQCDTLRDTPFSINATARLARHLLADFTGLDAADRPDYATPYNIDALIAVMGAASAHLMQTAYDIVGEDDSDLPTIEPPEPRPAVEVSREEQRESWQRIADCAAAELAKLDAGDQGGDTIPAAIIRRYLDLPASVDTETLQEAEYGLYVAIATATGIDFAALCTYGEVVIQNGGILLLGQGESRILSIDAEGRITRLDGDRGEGKEGTER